MAKENKKPAITGGKTKIPKTRNVTFIPLGGAGDGELLDSLPDARNRIVELRIYKNKYTVSVKDTGYKFISKVLQDALDAFGHEVGDSQIH